MTDLTLDDLKLEKPPEGEDAISCLGIILSGCWLFEPSAIPMARAPILSIFGVTEDFHDRMRDGTRSMVEIAEANDRDAAGTIRACMVEDLPPALRLPTAALTIALLNDRIDQDIAALAVELSGGRVIFRPYMDQAFSYCSMLAQDWNFDLDEMRLATRRLLPPNPEIGTT